jgi:hypothetical protein
MRIGIVGAHPATKLAAPYQDTDWTIWTCSQQHLFKRDDQMRADLPRWDAWFELHVPMGPDDYVNWLQSQPLVYVRDPEASFPGAQMYPEADLKARFGPFFFTSSVAYMMALALAQNPTTIGLWGVHMATNEEYAYQRSGCHYFIQKAWDAGIEVIVPDEARLLVPPREEW